MSAPAKKKIVPLKGRKSLALFARPGCHNVQ